MNADLKVSMKLQRLAQAVDEILTEIAGEHMGFALFVFPLDRTGHVNYVGNIQRAGMRAAITECFTRWDAGMADVPIHLKHN